MDGHHPGLQVAAPTRVDQRLPHRCPGEPAALLRGRGQRQHGQGLGLGQLGAQGGQGARVELPQGAAQRIHVPPSAPDQVLVGAGQHFDRLDLWAVAGDRAVVVAVGADQVGQHLGVAAVGLGPRAAMAAAVAAHHLWIDRIHLVAGGQQRPHQQAPVGLNPDRHLCRVLGMGGHQGVQLAHAGQAVADPPGGQHGPILVQQAQVMVGLAPVDPQEPHRVLLCSGLLSEPRRTCGALMAVLAWHDIPPAVRPPQHRPGHGLPQEL